MCIRLSAVPTTERRCRRRSRPGWHRPALLLLSLAFLPGATARAQEETDAPGVGELADAPAIQVAQLAAERIAAQERAWAARYEALLKALREHQPGKFDARV